MLPAQFVKVMSPGVAHGANEEERWTNRNDESARLPGDNSNQTLTLPNERLTSSPTLGIMTTPHDHQVARSTAIVGLGAVALIHLLELQGKLEETKYLGIGYIGLIVACVISGAMLLHRNDRLGWLLGGGASLATLVGYSLTRTVGLPSAKGDIGNWLEPIGLASIFIEGIVVAIALYALSMKAYSSTSMGE